MWMGCAAGLLLTVPLRAGGDRAEGQGGKDNRVAQGGGRRPFGFPNWDGRFGNYDRSRRSEAPMTATSRTRIATTRRPGAARPARRTTRLRSRWPPRRPTGAVGRQAKRRQKGW